MLWRFRSLVLGIVLGLLFSPGSGAENRRRLWLWLQGKAGETAPRVQAQLQQVTSQTFEQARQQVAPMAQQAQEKAAAMGQRVQQQVGQTAQQMTAKLGDMAGQMRSQGSAPAVAAGQPPAATGPAATADTGVTSPQAAPQAPGANTGMGRPVPTTAETPGPGLTPAERSPKNVLRQVDEAEAKAEGNK